MRFRVFVAEGDGFLEVLFGFLPLMQGNEDDAEMELGVEEVWHLGDGFFKVRLGDRIVTDGMVGDSVEVKDFRVVGGLSEELEAEGARTVVVLG